jgi:Na+/H+ antiporter NhaD/arsenite permease-like protein
MPDTLGPISIGYLTSGIIFATVFILLIARRRGKAILPIWIVFLVAAALVLLLGLASPSQAVSSIDPQVLLFLFSMFVISKGLEMSGDLESLSAWLVSHGKSGMRVYLLLSYVFGLASALIMNDSLAIMGTPIVINYAKRTNLDPRPFLYILAFSVSLGSAMTPVGNPQNSIIAIESGLKSPFIDMLIYIAPFSILTLGGLAILSRFFFGRIVVDSNHQAMEVHVDKEASKVARISLVVAVAGILMSDVFRLIGYSGLTIAEGALPGALILILFSRSRLELLRRIEWKVLVMFVGLFIYARGIYDGGLLNFLLPTSNGDLQGLGLLLTIIFSSIFLSQVVSNVPAVILLMPYLRSAISATDALHWTAFAAASTLAGTLTLIGAASNLIVVEQASMLGVRITYSSFFKYGAPVTAMSVLVLYLLFKGYSIF